MLTCIILTYIILSIIGAPASLAEDIQNVDGSNVVQSASEGLILPVNSSLSPGNDSVFVDARLQILCEDRYYGRNLKVKSCRNMFGYLKHDDEVMAFSDRDSGIPYDIPLPLRTYSSGLDPFDDSHHEICAI